MAGESGNWKLDRGILQKDVGVSWQATHNNWCLKGLHICLHWERGGRDSRTGGRMLQRTSTSGRPEWSICEIFQFNELRAEDVEKGLSGGWKQKPGTVGENKRFQKIIREITSRTCTLHRVYLQIFDKITLVLVLKYSSTVLSTGQRIRSLCGLD